MGVKIRRLIQQQWAGLIALFLVLSGGTALASHETIFSSDIVNGEVRQDDLAANSVGSNKIIDQSVKNADLSIGASSSNTIADGGIQAIDVKNDTLTGTQINESSLERVATSEAVDFRANAGETGSFSLGGFTLAFNCRTTPVARALQVSYSSAVNDASFHAAWNKFLSPNAQAMADDDVDSGFSSDLTTSLDLDDSAGTMVYTRPDGGSVVVSFQAEDSDSSGSPEALGGTKDCLFSGVGHFMP
jgi:hypothetical protein